MQTHLLIQGADYRQDKVCCHPQILTEPESLAERTPLFNSEEL